MNDIKQLLAEKQRFEDIINATTIGTWEWEIQTGKVIFNKAWAKMIGYSLNDLPQTIDTWIKHTHPEDIKMANEMLELVFSKKLPYYEIELRMIHKNGNLIWILDKGEVIKWSKDNKPLLMVGSHTDITKLKQIYEELENSLTQSAKSEELFRSLYEKAPLGYQSLNSEGKYINVNEAQCQLLGYSKEEMIGKYFWDFMTEDSSKIVKDTFAGFLKKGKVDSVFELVKKNGDIIKAGFVGRVAYNPDGTFKQTHCIVMDITSQLEARALIEASKEKIKLILDSTAEAIYGTDKNGHCTFVNRGFLELLGYENEEDIIEKNIHELTHHSYEDGTHFPEENCEMSKAIFDGKSIHREAVFWRKDGTSISVDYFSTPQIKNGLVIGSVVSFKDNSERIKLTNNLMYERNVAQMYLDVVGVMLLALDTNGNITLINKKGCEILEIEEKDAIGKNWFDNFIPKDFIRMVKQVFQNVFDKKAEMVTHYENEVITTTGKMKYINWYNSILYDIDNNIIGVLSSGEDVTDNKRNELALYESNLRFQTLYNKAPMGYQSLDINGRFLEINQTWLDMLGYEVEEVIGKWFGDFLSIEYREPFKERFEFFKQQGKIHSEFKMLHKNGEKIFIEFEGLIGYDDNNQFEKTYCTLNDIAKRRKIQNQLQQSEKNLKLAQSIAKVGSWELDLNTEQIRASEEAFKIYELDRTSEFLDYETVQNMVFDEDREIQVKALNDLVIDNKPYNITFRLHTRKGAIKYINSKASLFTDKENKPVKVIGVIHDITELKNKEIALEYINNHDYLTDLYNRRYYFEQFKQLDKPEYYPLGVMMLDVNGLKIINDAFGHGAGDRALKMLGDILKETFKQKDIVSRIGGDEFAVLLPNTSSNKLQEFKDQIKESAKKHKIENIELSLAVGYELKKSIEEDPDDILKLAENHMYRHKTTEGSSVRNRAINAILQTLTTKYDTERKHSEKVSFLCKEIGIEMKLREDEIKELEQAGLFHDIGKISIPDNIIDKPGKLTDEEYEIIKTHPEIGYQILRAADEYSDLAIHALYHHERWDGKGYPSGMKGNDIPLFSRIIGVVDAYEAMTSDRPYRKKMSKEYAVSEIIKYSATQFDPKIAKIFVEKVLKATWH